VHDDIQADETTAREPLRVVLLTQGGAEAVLIRLLHLGCCRVVGVMLEAATPRRRALLQRVRRVLRYEGLSGVAGRLITPLRRSGHRRDAAADLLVESRERLGDLASAHQVPVHAVADYHAAASLSLLASLGADLGVLWGTNILQSSVFSLPRLGSINLHQGVTPHYRGGPPLFWELFNGESLVGATVHVVSAHVDAGAIVLQDTWPLVYDYRHDLDFERFIAEARAASLDRCARLVAEAVELVATGRAHPHVPDTTIGQRYRLPTIREKRELRRRLKARRPGAAPAIATDLRGGS
jgi:folate-dependent phosphoribosylglycinamide formyltransferase PurN